MFLLGEPGQRTDRIAFSAVTVSPNSSRRTDAAPLSEQGWQRAHEVEAVAIGVGDRLGEPNMVWEQAELHGFGR